jgi:hypothetical protein
MVLLTMTRTIVEALGKVQSLTEEQSTPEGKHSADGQNKDGEVSQKDANTVKSEGHAVTVSTSNGSYNGVVGDEKEPGNQEPRLSNPQLGNPISHGQVIDLWKQLRASDSSPMSLDTLLRGSQVYAPPPKPKPEPVSQRRCF